MKNIINDLKYRQIILKDKMEPQLSVLLYSKYSPLSKKLMGLIQSSQVDFSHLFSLQTLCVDNEQIRNRIQKNDQLDITSVPCILLIYPDGGIEKYDQGHEFEWVEQMIKKFAPPTTPSIPSPPQKTDEQRWREQKALEQKAMVQKAMEQKALEEEKEISEREKVREEHRKKYEEHIGHKSSPNKPRRRRRIRKEPSSSEEEEDEGGRTRIEDLDSDTQTDRHRHRKPIGSIREDSGNYTIDDDLFSGSQTDMRKPKRSAVKGLNNIASEQKSMDLMAKAKELAKGREESDPRPPSGHPSGNRM